MKLGTCNEMFEGWDLARQLAFIARCGYQGVELAPFTIAKAVTDVPAPRQAEIARQAREQGHGGDRAALAPGGPEEGLYITDPDPAVRQRTVDYLQELMRFCADVEGRCWSSAPPSSAICSPASPGSRPGSG